MFLIYLQYAHQKSRPARLETNKKAPTAIAVGAFQIEMNSYSKSDNCE